jgi:hypothetical protein
LISGTQLNFLQSLQAAMLNIFGKPKCSFASIHCDIAVAQVFVLSGLYCNNFRVFLVMLAKNTFPESA